MRLRTLLSVCRCLLRGGLKLCLIHSDIEHTVHSWVIFSLMLHFFGMTAFPNCVRFVPLLSPPCVCFVLPWISAWRIWLSAAPGYFHHLWRSCSSSSLSAEFSLSVVWYFKAALMEKVWPYHLVLCKNRYQSLFCEFWHCFEILTLMVFQTCMTFCLLQKCFFLLDNAAQFVKVCHLFSVINIWGVSRTLKRLFVPDKMLTYWDILWKYRSFKSMNMWWSF